MKAEEFAAAVSAAYPVPEETFARAKWMGEAADACNVLALRISWKPGQSYEEHIF